MWQSAVKRFVWSVDQKGEIETEVHYLPFQIHSMFKFTNITIALNFLSIYWICWFVDSEIKTGNRWQHSLTFLSWRMEAKILHPFSEQLLLKAAGCRVDAVLPAVCSGPVPSETGVDFGRVGADAGCCHTCASVNTSCVFLYGHHNIDSGRTLRPTGSFRGCFSIISGLFFFSCDDF